MSYDPIHINVKCMGRRARGGRITANGLALHELRAGTHIYVIKNAVPAWLCRKIISFTDRNKGIQEAGETESGPSPNKKCRELQFKKPLLDDSLEAGVINQELYRRFRRAFGAINIIAPAFFNGACVDTGYQVQHYAPDDGWFNWHTDTSGLRSLAAILYLNTVPVGGETEFWYQDVSVKPEAGKLLIFPAENGYPHRGVPAKSDKYIITTFMEAR